MMQYRFRRFGHRPHLRVVATPQAASDQTETEDIPTPPRSYGWRVSARFVAAGVGLVMLLLALGYAALLGFAELYRGSF